MDLRGAYARMAEATARNVEINEGDYIDPEDGLLRCGQCGSRKQVRVKICGKEMVHYVNCECAMEAIREEKEAERRRERQARIRELRKIGFPEDTMCHMRFDLDDGKDGKLMRTAKRYADNFGDMLKEGKGLLLFGDVDGGKTFAAACIVNELIDRGYPCMITSLGRIVNKLRGMYEGRQEYIDSLNAFDLLVLDDMGTEGDSQYVSEIVYQVVNNRYNAGKPTIVTTNISAQELKNPPDLRRAQLYSRMYEMMIPIECAQQNRRKKALRDTHSRLKEVLGL